MKRSPLKRKTPLSPGSGRLGRAPLAQRSSKTKARYAAGSEYNKAKTQVRLHSGGRCEIVATDQCRGVASDPHHVLPSGPDTAANLLDCCRWCHDWVHAHPTEAREHGWLRSRGKVEL